MPATVKGRRKKATVKESAPRTVLGVNLASAGQRLESSDPYSAYPVVWINADVNRTLDPPPEIFIDLLDPRISWKDVPDRNGEKILRPGAYHRANASHFLEHASWDPDGRDLLSHFMAEVNQLLVRGGIFTVEVPFAGPLNDGYKNAFRDPLHRRYFVDESFEYLAPPHGFGISSIELRSRNLHVVMEKLHDVDPRPHIWDPDDSLFDRLAKRLFAVAHLSREECLATDPIAARIFDAVGTWTAAQAIRTAKR